MILILSDIDIGYFFIYNMKKRKTLGFRFWFFFRMGWSTYFAFIFAAVNTLTVTYFLAVDNYPILQQIFPSFIHYVVIISIIGIPLLVIIGYSHYKKTAAFSSEADVLVESNPYHYRVAPGWNQFVVFPLYLSLTNMMIKWSQNQKLTEDEIKEIQNIQKKIDVLIKGGFIRSPADSALSSDKKENE